ncbi:MAG: helix-turn-helix transcriptional regulator [Solirubrobacterales bacterium]
MDLPNPSEDVLAQPTRARIFALLVELKGAAGTAELARRLGLHPNGVRRHLEQMREAGLVERQRAPARRGRPRDRWLVAAGADPAGERPTAYAELAAWLARAIPAGPRRLREVERIGREIGIELAPDDSHDLPEAFRQIVTALGFQPELAVGGDGELVCRLGNCPYRDAVRENADVVCTLHRGITAGLLAELDPTASLERFEPRDPDRGGCLVEVGGGSWPGPTSEPQAGPDPA